MDVKDIIAPEQDPSGKLAEFAADLKYEDLPKEQREYIKKDILDMMSSFLGGSSGPCMKEVRESVCSWGVNGFGKGKILVFGDKLPETLAAFANGVMARAVDMGDTGVLGGHICEWIVPTLLSGLERAERPVSGKEFMTAFAAGAEWGTREHTTIRLQYNNNLVPGECAGSRYATVALGKMYGFHKEQIWDAAGMSYCAHTMTTQQKYTEGTPDARLQHGYVAADALQITDLVRRGLKSVHGIYMGTAGLLKSICHDNIESPDLLTKDLGKRWMWHENVTNKLYAGCYYSHTPIYGVVSLMKEMGIGKENIEKIHCITSQAGAHVWEPKISKYAPKTPEAAMFSAPYGITQAVFYGDCFLDAYKPENFGKNIKDPEFTAFMNCITQEVDESIQSTFDDYYIEITTKDGHTYKKQECNTPGNQKNPVTWEQVEEKFWKCTKFSAVDLGEEKYKKVIEICKNLENIEDMKCLVATMTPDTSMKVL